jgi:hypothetical protein
MRQDKPQETIRAFIDRMGIKFTATRIPERPDKDDATSERERAWQRDAFHFLVSFRRGAESLTTYYSMGKGHAAKYDPTGKTPARPVRADEVLDALLSDAESWDNARPVIVGPDGSRTLGAPDVDTFASELGYDSDPGPYDPATGRHKPESFVKRFRACERAFKACGETHAKLIKMLGAEGYAALRDCERL